MTTQEARDAERDAIVAMLQNFDRLATRGYLEARWWQFDQKKTLRYIAANARALGQLIQSNEHREAQP